MIPARTDRHGNAVSTDSRPAVEAFDRAAAALLGFRGDPLAEIDAALAVQPDFAMGHAFRAGLMVMAAEGPAAAEGLASVAAGEALRHATLRERAHLHAARAWCEGDLALAQRRYGEIVAQHPRDLFALQVAHQVDHVLGDAPALRDRPTAALRAWRQGEAGFSWLLGMQAFGLEETGSYGAAEEAGRMALGQEPGDAWALHAVAHVMEMQGRDREGVAFLAGREKDWAPATRLAGHTHAHMALFHLERGAVEQAVAIYDRAVAPRPGASAAELADAAALLWRLLLRGAETGRRFGAVSLAWQQRGGAGFHALHDLHAVMAHLGAGREEMAAQVLGAMRAATAGPGSTARLTREVALPLAEGLFHFARGDYAGAAARIAPVRPHAFRLGGSHAQRDVIALTQLEAALRGGEPGMARALAAARVAAKPESDFARGQLRRSGDLPRAA